jgi:CDP-diacylglycerol--glycerol-3-phosphate 3-phosphatidyltransferase
MPTIYDIKPRFQALWRPLVKRLAAAGVTANQVTLAAAVLSLATGALLALHPDAAWALLLVPLVLFVRMALNAIDGMLAREHGQKSHLGAILNEISDVVSDAALYLPFALLPGVTPWVVVLVVVLAVISEMTGVVAVQIGASRRYDGPLGKSDRAFLFGLIALLGGLGVTLHPWVNPVLIVAAGLLVLTILNRARRALAEVAGRKSGP